MKRKRPNLFAGQSGAARDRGADAPLMTVSQLTLLIKDVLNETYSDIVLVGETSGVKHYHSGHVYLTLKDEGAVINAVIWQSLASKLPFRVEDGMEVVCRGSVDVYPPRGNYQFIIEKIEPRGAGALQIMFHKLMEKLRKEGLFAAEAKKPLPPYPARIGIITSPTGAAVRDMIRIISRRYPPAALLIHPVRVQGEAAAGEIAAAIKFFNEHCPDLDVLIVGRGGGSLEDLWPFNEEIVARAIFQSRIPVISAVGHETDVTISDMVADRRAATPSEAAELVVPDREEVVDSLRALAGRLAALLKRRLSVGEERLAAVGRSYALRRPDSLLRLRAQRVDDLFADFQSEWQRALERKNERLGSLAGRLDALSPLGVLARGYSVTMLPDGTVVRDSASLRPGDEVVSRLGRGKARSRVTSTEPEKKDPPQ